MHSSDTNLKRRGVSTFGLRWVILAFASLSFGVASVTQAQQYKDIKRLGTSSTVCKGGVHQAADFQNYFAENQEIFVQILQSAGWSGDPEDLFQTIANGQFSEVSISPGATFEWMGMIKKGTPTAGAPIRWAGKTPFSAFALEVESNGSIHKFVVPKICCNIALEDSRAVPVPPAPEPEPIAAKKALWPLAALFVGHERQTRNLCGCDVTASGDLVGAGGGFIIPNANERAGLLLQAGGIANLDDSTYSTVFADIGAEFLVGEKGFLGTGVGVWDINDSSERDASLFVHGGVDTPYKVAGGTLQWFLEGRAFADDLNEISDNYVGLTGLRVLWK